MEDITPPVSPNSDEESGSGLISFFSKFTQDENHWLSIWACRKPLRMAVLFKISQRCKSPETDGRCRFFLSECEYEKFGLKASQKTQIRRVLDQLCQLGVITKLNINEAKTKRKSQKPKRNVKKPKRKNMHGNSSEFWLHNNTFVDCSKTANLEKRSENSKNRRENEKKRRVIEILDKVDTTLKPEKIMQAVSDPELVENTAKKIGVSITVVVEYAKKVANYLEKYPDKEYTNLFWTLRSWIAKDKKLGYDLAPYAPPRDLTPAELKEIELEKARKRLRTLANHQPNKTVVERQKQLIEGLERDLQTTKGP